MNYYNEIDPFAGQWLRNLIAGGHIPDGRVDERDIRLVQPEELAGFTQCHFFAGIGGWSVALAIAGWRGCDQVWTGSCPCQPFSLSGKKRGTSDDRHLWPEFLRLISKCRPPVVIGEQVASDLGRAWLDGVRTDLEALAYAVGGADLCAAGIGAPHIRQRLYWVADSGRVGHERVGGSGEAHGAASPDQNQEKQREWGGPDSGDCVSPVRVGISCGERLEEREGEEVQRGAVRHEGEAARPGGRWSDFRTVRCTDGKTRRVGSGVCPLAYGVPARVGKLRAYGNAVVPEVAAAFIKAYLECRPR